MESIAIVGTGVAGMGAGYFLKDKFDITFFEKNNYPGGHTNTLTIDEEGNSIYIDSAFMVYNDITYPNLKRLFEELDVKTKPTDMTFSVTHVPSGLEYCGTGLSGLFAQRKNLFSPRHWKMLLDMDRFNKESVKILDDEKYLSYSLYDYVKEHGYGDDFLNKFLIPMSSAVWSTEAHLMLKFPAVTLVRFFKNHGFLGLDTHYQWRTVVEGSQRYREKILNHFEGKVMLNTPIKKILRENGKAIVIDDRGERKVFDKVILASHADESLAMLGDQTQDEAELLSKFRYQDNQVTLHNDSTIMPKTKRAWSSWNYRIGDKNPTTIYWMNSLQHVSEKKNYFISVNEQGEIDQSKVLWDTNYAHPIFDVEAIKAQKQLKRLNENSTTYFCGGYFKYGFHEDALTSGLDVARAIAGQQIWN